MMSSTYWYETKSDGLQLSLLGTRAKKDRDWRGKTLVYTRLLDWRGKTLLHARLLSTTTEVIGTPLSLKRATPQTPGDSYSQRQVWRATLDAILYHMAKVLLNKIEEPNADIVIVVQYGGPFWHGQFDGLHCPLTSI